SADSRYLARAAEQGGAIIYDLDRQQTVRSWPLSSGVTHLFFLAEPNEALFLIRERGNIRGEVWNISEEKILRVIPNLSRHVAVSPDRRWLLVGQDHDWRVLELASGAVTGNLSNSALSCDKVPTKAISVDGRHLAFWTSESRLSVWNVASGM